MISEFYPDPERMPAETLHEAYAHGTPDFPAGCFEDDLTKGEFSWHWHDDFEFGIVTEGSAIIAGGDRREHLEAGDFFLFPPAALHAAWPADAGPCKDHTIVFHPKLIYGYTGSIFERTCIEPYRSPLLQEVLVLRGKEAEPFSERFISAWKACSDPASIDPFTARNVMTGILYDFSKHLPEIPNVNTEHRQREERTKKMLHYIEEHTADMLTTPVIAAAASISVSECLRCFHAILGMTPIKYVKERRLQLASDLLEKTDLSISDIGVRCGFDGMSYFAKVFREAKGLTPGKWREERKKTNELQ